MKTDICPRCGENEVRARIEPERKVKVAPEKNVLVVRDKRRYECGFCHWWSEAAWNGVVWVWETAPKLGVKQRVALEERIKRLKKKRRARGGKGK